MKVAFLGLGDIGAPMASHLARDPFDLVVWNRTASKAEDFVREHKARVARTPAEAVRDAQVVITCLPSSVEVEAVLHGENGMLESLRGGAVLIDCTSGDPPTSRSIAAELGGRGVEFIDAPVSGGTTAAKAGTLTVMWGGEESVFERVRLVMEAFGKKIVHAGPVGSGDALKAVNNALLAVHILSAAEGLAGARQGGSRSKGCARSHQCLERAIEHFGESDSSASADARFSANVSTRSSREGHRNSRGIGGGSRRPNASHIIDRGTVPRSARDAWRESGPRRSREDGRTGKRRRDQVNRRADEANQVGQRVSAFN